MMLVGIAFTAHLRSPHDFFLDIKCANILLQWGRQHRDPPSIRVRTQMTGTRMCTASRHAGDGGIQQINGF